MYSIRKWSIFGIYRVCRVNIIDIWIIPEVLGMWNSVYISERTGAWQMEKLQNYSESLKIVMYHYVRDLKNSRYPEIKGLDYELFKEQITFLEKNFNVVRMEDVIAYYELGEQLPQNALLLTFDDGYIDHYTHVLPVLSKHKMQGSFFVPGKVFTEHCLLDVNKIHYILASADINVLCKTLFKYLDDYRCEKWQYEKNEILFEKYAVENRFDSAETIFLKRILQTVLPEELRGIISSRMLEEFVGVPEKVLAHELYLNRDQMEDMKRQGMFFGLHGYDHYWMNRLEPEELKNDITKGLESLKGLIDEEKWVINYPYGSYNEQVIESLKGSGCILGLSTEVRTADLTKENRYALPRYDTNDFPPKSNQYLNI